MTVLSLLQPLSSTTRNTATWALKMKAAMLKVDLLLAACSSLEPGSSGELGVLMGLGG